MKILGKKRKSSGLFRRYLSVTLSIILLSYIVAGGALMLFVAGLWINERYDLLEENTSWITDKCTYALESFSLTHYSATREMVNNILYQASDTLDSDFFLVNADGDVVFCKDTMENPVYVVNDVCVIHSTYHIPEDVMNTMRDGKKYRSTGDFEGILANTNNSALQTQYFVVGCPVFHNGEFQGAVFGVMPVSQGLLVYVLGIFRMFLLSACFSFIISFIIVYIASYKLVKPLRQMSDAAKQYACGDFSSRVYIKRSKHFRSRRTEIDDLADSFNTMAGELAALELSRRNFVSNVSHELKTPMTTIGGFIDGILDGTIDKENEKKYLTIVSEEVKRLSRLVTGMLNMSKIEAGKMDIKPVNFDISEMLFNTLLSFEQVLEKKNIDVRGLDTFTENPIFADKDMINQVIYNLVDNAVKFTPEGGYIEVASKSDAEKIIIRILNSGKGIAPDEIDKIFERFYKVDKSRSYDVKGAGMGLYIVKTIIELHGGTIEAHSEVGKYTEFIFNLPK